MIGVPFICHSLSSSPSSSLATLEIQGGSGYFHVTTSDGSLAEVEYDISKPREVIVIPAVDGDLLVQAFDLCVDGSASANTNVHIAGAEWWIWGWTKRYPGRMIVRACLRVRLYV